MQQQMVTLDTLGRGAALELFQREFNNVLENIMDPNTSDIAKRSITLKVEIKPDADRSMGAVSIQCKSALAPVKDCMTRMFFQKKNGQISAAEHNLNQPDLPFNERAEESQSPADGKVVSFNKGAQQS